MYSNSYQKYLEQKEKNKSGQNLSDTLQQFRERAIADYSAQQQLEEESVARGRAMVEAQRQRDADLLEKQSVSDFVKQNVTNALGFNDPLRGGLDVGVTPRENAQAYRNAQRNESLDDAFNRLTGSANNPDPHTEEGRRQAMYDIVAGLTAEPQVPDRYSYQGMSDYIGQANAKQANAYNALDSVLATRQKREEERKQAEENKRLGNSQRVAAINNALKQAEKEAEKVRSTEAEIAKSNNVQGLLDKRTELVNELAYVQSQLTPYANLDVASATALRQTNAVFNELKTQEEALQAQIADYDAQLEKGYNYSGMHDPTADLRVADLRNELQTAEKARYASLKYNPDFAANSGIPKNADLTKDMKLGYINGELYDVVDGTIVPRSARTGKGIDFGTEKNPWSFVDKLETLQYVTEDERATYNYLYNKEGEKSADKYLESLMPELNARERKGLEKKAAQWARQNPFLASVQSVIASPGKVVSSVGQIADYITDGKADENAWYNRNAYVTDKARSAVGEYNAERTTKALMSKGVDKDKAEWWGKAANFGYGTAMSMADFLFNAFITGGFNGGEGAVAKVAQDLSLAIMGAESSATAYISAKDRGLTDDQAILLSAIAGLAEVVTEKVSVENLFSEEWEEQALKYFIKNLVSEGAEEGASDLINWTADFLVARDKNEWKTAFEEKKADNPKLSDKEAWKQVIRDKAVEIGLDVLGGSLTGGIMAGFRIGSGKIGNAVDNAQFRMHNKVTAADSKNGGNVGATVDGMLADLINRPDTEWASGLADIANQFRGTVKGNTINSVRDYIRETARNQADAVDKGAYTALADYLTPYTNQDGKKVDNRNAVWQLAEERNGTAKQTAQNTQAENAPEQTAPSTATAEPSTEPSSESTTPSTESTTASSESTTSQIQATTAENQAITSENQATTQQTAQNAPQTSEESVQAENAAPVSNNASGANEAQRGSVSATDDGRALLLRELNVSEEATDAEVAQELLKRVDSRKVRNRITGLRNTAANNQAEVLDRMRQSGQYTPEQIEAARQTAVAVGRELGNLTSEVGVQKAVNAANAALQKAGIKAKIVVDNVAKVDYNGRVNERGSYKDSDGTIHVSPYLDTNEAIMGVLAHEMFHKAADGSERTQLVDDILAARNAILNASQSGRYGISRVTRAVIGNNSMGDFVESYGDLLMKDFGLTDEGQTALQNKLNANPGMDTDTALKQLCDENEEAFWEMWHDNKNLGTAQNYMKEEVAAHFFEELGSQRGEAIMRELMRNDRNLFERIIDAVRRYFHRNDPDYAKNETYNRIMNAYERIAAEESGLDARKLKGTAAQKAEIAESTLMTDGNGNPVMRYGLDAFMEPLHLTFQKDEDGVTHLLDSDNKPITELTAQDVMDSDYGVIIQNNIQDGIISTDEGQKEAQFLADTINLMLKTQDVDMIWAVNSTIGFQPIQPGERGDNTFDAKKGDDDKVQSKFAGFTANSDPQYSTTIDFTTICKKTQQVIDTMSKIMKEKKSGLTQDEIINIVYDEVAKAGEPVPCPVCYVFARWVGLGGLFDNMYQWQEVDYPRSMDTSKIREDIARLGRQIDGLINQKLTQKQKDEALAEEVTDEEAEAEPDKKTPFGKMKNKLAKELAKERKLLEIKQMKHDIQGTEALTAEEQAEFDRLTEQINYLDRWTWLTNVRLRDDYNEHGYVRSDILFDINAGKVFAEQYAPAWAYRTSRGPSMGKAATPYAAEHLGQIITGIAKPSTVSGHTLGNLNKDVFLGTNGQSNQDVEDTLKAARENAKKQNLLNGQRLQSTSDFRYEYALDYLMALFELQAAEAKAQMYTKVPEMVAMAASCGVEINLSLMPLGDGYVIENGKKKLAFSDVTGMFWEDAKLLSSMYDNVQPIMVGINHDHIRLCMREDWISFIIPYHSSGGSEGRYVAMMKAVGEEVTNRTDYSDYQKDFKIKDATPEQIAAREARKMIVTGKASEMTDEQKNAVRNNAILSQLHIRFYGTDVDGNEARVDDKYLNAKDKGTGRDSDTLGVFLSPAQAETIMPYEFWDKTVTLQNAQQNGKLFTEYCEALGLHPRFSGWDKNGKYHKDYDFTNEAGYWKVLPDRSMYNHVVGTSQYGTYHEQKPVNISHLQEDYLASNRSETDSNVEGDTPGMKAARAYLGGRIRNENGEFVRDNDPNIKKPSQDNDPTKTADIAAKSIARIEAERAKQNRSYKEQQFDLIQSSVTDENESWIHSPEDILTFGEAVEESGGADTDMAPDFKASAVQKALETGKVRVYSPTKFNPKDPSTFGTFVTTSQAAAKEQMGKGKPSSRMVTLQDVAWVDALQGQYAPLGVTPPTAPKEIDTRITDAVRETSETSRQSRLVTPEQDEEYMEAVESGDTEKQQQMVDEAARAAGAYTDEDGNPVKMYHGTDSDFTVFDPKRIGSAHNPDQYDEIFAAVSRIGYFATDNLRYAQEYSTTGKTMPLYMIAQNPYEMAYRDFAKFESDDYDETVNRILDFKQELIEQGHDGIVAYTDDGYTEYIAFNNTQMKSADPVTYDDEGNVIPLSERFNPEAEDIRYSISAEEDEAYMDAVESGDEETQNRIIDEAAKAAGYNYRGYHGTNRKFTTFIPGYATGWGKGIYVASNMEDAENYGSNVMPVYLKMENPYTGQKINAENTQAYKKYVEDYYKKIARNEDITVEEAMQDRQKPTVMDMVNDEDVNYLNAALRELGYDGIIIDGSNDITGTEMVVFDPSQVKSADPVTYDDDGNVIPPSQRFNPDSDDIRESRMLKSVLDPELERARDNLDLMKAQLRDNMASDVAKAIKATDLDEMVQRYSDMFGEYIPEQTIREYLRPVWKAMQKTRASGETAVDRLESVWREAETAARKMLEDTSYETTLKDAIGDEATLNGLKALYNRLNVRINGNDPGYYYIKPDMVTAAGSNDAWNETRRQLNGVKLKGFATQAEAEASGRKPISELFTKLISDGGAYNDLFTPDETASDFDKLSQIATAYALAKEAEADPYQRRYYGNEENTAAVYNLANDITYALESRAEPTKMAKVKAQFDERYAKMQSNYEERMRKQAEKATEKYDKLLEKTKGRDIKRAQRMVLGRIAKDISALDKLQNHPSKEKNKYIPQRLLGTVAKVREAVQNFANRSGKTIDPARLTELQQSAMDETQNFMEGLGQGLKGVGSATEANARQDPNITDVFIRQADNLIQQLRDLRADIEENHPARPTVDENGKRITPTSEMIAEDNARDEAMFEYFNTVRQLLDMTLQAIRNENKMILNGRTQDLRDISKLLAYDLRQHRQKDVSLRHRNLGDETGNWFDMGTFGLMSADAALQRLGDNWHSFIARSVREGQNRQMKHQSDFSDFMRETIGDYDITKGGFYGDYVELERPDGTKFNVTRHELMSLYALWNRPAGRLHLENGGGTFINQNGQAFHDNNVVLTDKLVKEYTDHLTAQEKEIVDNVVDYMSHEASKWGNDVSMYVYGYRLFNEDSYFPMEVADYANKRSFADPTMPGSGLNPGFTQALTRSKKPLAIRDFFDVVNDHILGMANYNAYGAAAHDLDRILNSSLMDGEGKTTSMIELLRKTYGNSAVTYLKEFVQKLAGTKHDAPSWLNNMRTVGYLAGSLYKRAAVSWNLSTAAKQPLSMIRAANVIDPKYLLFRKPLSPAEYQAAKEKMESLSGIAKIKSLGFSDTGHAKSLQATYDDKYFSDSNFIRRGLGSNKAARGAFRFNDKFTEIGMYLAGKADEMTWVNIWDAVTKEVSDKYPNLTADELDAKITERFNEVIGLTQVVDSILDSAPVLQEKIFSLAFPFMNEPVKSASNLILAASKVNQPGGKKKLVKAAGLQLLSAVLLEPLVTTIASMWRDEKDDIGNGFWDHFLEKMFGIKKDEDDDGKSDTDWKSVTTSNAFAGIWSMPFITQLYDVYSNALQDYDNTSIDRAAVVDLVKASQNLFKYSGASNSKSAKTQNRLWREFAESFASVFGVPAKTIRREISGTARMFMNLAKADELKWEYNKLSYNLENSNARSQKGFYDILAHAYATGDMESYERFRKELNDIVTDNSTLVDVNTIVKNIEKRGGNVQPGDPLWNVEVQARFRLDAPVKGWKNENFLTGVYKQAEAAGITDEECKKVLYSLPDKYEPKDEDGEEIEMTPAQYDQFASDCGDLAYKLVSQLSSQSNAKAWSDLTIDQQLYAISKVYDYSKRKFRKDINPDLDISGMGKPLVAVYETAPMDTSKIVSTVMEMAKKYDKKKERKKK